MPLFDEKCFRAIIPGRPYVKKTTADWIGNGRFKKPIYSRQYKRWEHIAILAFRKAMTQNFFKTQFPIHDELVLEAIFFFENKMGQPDLSALFEGVQDALQEAGVIRNDKQIIGFGRSTAFFDSQHDAKTLISLYPAKREDKIVFNIEYPAD